jgi:hypothetical protein
MLTMLLAGSAMGQRKVVQVGGFRGYDSLLQDASVQKELKLTEEQLAKTQAAIQKVRQQHPAESPSGEDLKAISQETLQELGGTLKPEQTRRLKQIGLQQQGLRAFSDTDVQKALKLSDEEKKKIQTIEDDYAQQARKLFQRSTPGSFPVKLQKMATLRKEAIEKAVAVLNPEQQKSWKELVGAPFDWKR